MSTARESFDHFYRTFRKRGFGRAEALRQAEVNTRLEKEQEFARMRASNSRALQRERRRDAARNAGLRAERAQSEILRATPSGYKKPANWDQLWIHRHHPERILLAHHSGWEPVDGIETYDTTKRRPILENGRPVIDPKTGSPRMETVSWEAVRRGVVHFHGTRMTEVSLKSLRIPESGDSTLRHG